jgi:hypothetical protein
MKKYLVFFLFLILTTSCGKNTQTIEDTQPISTKQLRLYRFKVIGLADSIIADSVWKMVFTVNGIEQLVVRKVDSTVLVNADSLLVTKELLMDEIEKRGAVILY